MIFRNQNARPWPKGIPTRQGERCTLSDLLIPECACRIHKKPEPDDDQAHEEEFDFS